MKFLYLVILVFSARVYSQITVDAISTDTVDIFSKQHLQQTDHIPSGISWLSFIVPGSGHQLVGSGNKALGYIAVDICALAGVIFFRNYSNRLAANYKAYAAEYAGVTSSISNDYYWQIIGNFNNYSDYHQTLDLVRDTEKRFAEQQYFWNWQDETYRKDYVSFQKTAKKFNTISSFFIGAMILNRVVSFIDLRTMLKNNRFRGTSLSFKPVSLGHSANGVVLETTF